MRIRVFSPTPALGHRGALVVILALVAAFASAVKAAGDCPVPGQTTAGGGASGMPQRSAAAARVTGQPESRALAARWRRVSVPQQWKSVESTAVNLRFTVPPRWQTRTGVKKDRPYIEAVSPDAALYVVAYSFRDARATLDDVLDQALAELDVELDDQPQEEDINDLEALVGEASDTVNGREVGMFVVAASYGATRYIAYIMSDLARFDANAKVMNRILDSFAPISR